MASQWLIALESSTARGGAALMRDRQAVGEVFLEEGLRHGRDLMPAAAKLLADNGLTARDLWCVAVSVGPGSYTGCRVGVMAAKALAYAAGCGLTAASGLAALAEQCRAESTLPAGTRIMVVQDARRDEVYCGLYEAGDDSVERLDPDRAVTPEEAAARFASLRDQGAEPHPAGTGFVAYADLFKIDDGGRSICTHPTAAAVARLGWRRMARGETADPLALQPTYLRRDADADWRHDILISRESPGPRA